MSNQHFTALIVDDDTGLLALIEEVVSDWFPRCEISTATNGREALAKIRDETYTFLLTDFKMPVMDGNSLLKSLKIIDDRRRPSNILFLSNYLEPGDPSNGYTNVHFMEKLGFQDKLRQYMEQALDREVMADKGIFTDNFRASPRQDDRVEVEIKLGKETKLSFLKDLSPKGMAITFPKDGLDVLKGKKVDFNLNIPEFGPVSMRGEIIHRGSTHSQSLGVKFIEVDGKTIDLINKYIRWMIS